MRMNNIPAFLTWKSSSSRKPLKRGGQCDRILAHLSRGRTITSLEAFRRFGVTSLHRRLEELRERGHRIDRGEFYTTRQGARVKRYRLLPSRRSSGRRP